MLLLVLIKIIDVMNIIIIVNGISVVDNVIEKLFLISALLLSLELSWLI